MEVESVVQQSELPIANLFDEEDPLFQLPEITFDEAEVEEANSAWKPIICTLNRSLKGKWSLKFCLCR